MYISIDIGAFPKYNSARDVVKLLKGAGFDAYDFSFFNASFSREFFENDDYLERAKSFREYADSLGIACNQTHAPFPTFVPLRDGVTLPWWMPQEDKTSYNARLFTQIERTLEVSAILGAKVCVVHPCNDATAEENAAFYRKLEPTARRVGVKIALENMWNEKDGKICAAACSHHDDFKKHLDLLPKDVFVACLDVGHAEMGGLDTSAVEMIYTLKDRLHALHIHDNDKVHDSHNLPFTMKIPFNEVIAALKAVGYKDDITFESSYFTRNFPIETYPQAAALSAAMAEYIRKQLS